MKKILFGTAAAVLALVAAPASAANFLFDLTANNIVGHGTFVTQDTPNASGGYLITSTTGTVMNNSNSSGITGPNTYLNADNLLYAYQTPLLDFFGTSFSLANGTDVNIYYSGGYRYIRMGAGASQALTSFTITPLAAAVPEPATWAMMIAGFGAIGGILRRRTARIVYV